jgi:hypothetical protein
MSENYAERFRAFRRARPRAWRIVPRRESAGWSSLTNMPQHDQKSDDGPVLLGNGQHNGEVRKL